MTPVPQPPKPRYCRECGQAFYPARSDQEFHSTKCRQDWHRRRTAKGAELYDLAIAWRLERVEDGFHAITQACDEIARDERERRRKRKTVVDAAKAAIASDGEGNG